jgi:hypothetical protein
MASNAQVVATKAKNSGFKTAIMQGLSVGAETQLNTLVAVAPGAIGYGTFKKLTDLYTKMALAPEIYAESFARLVLAVDDTRDVETDASTIATWLVESGSIHSRALAGVNLQDDL